MRNLLQGISLQNIVCLLQAHQESLICSDYKFQAIPVATKTREVQLKCTIHFHLLLRMRIYPPKNKIAFVQSDSCISCCQIFIFILSYGRLFMFSSYQIMVLIFKREQYLYQMSYDQENKVPLRHKPTVCLQSPLFPFELTQFCPSKEKLYFLLNKTLLLVTRFLGCG